MLIMQPIEREDLNESIAYRLWGMLNYMDKNPGLESGALRKIDYRVGGEVLTGTLVKATQRVNGEQTVEGFKVSVKGGTVNFDITGRAEVGEGDDAIVYQLLTPLEGDAAIIDAAFRAYEGEKEALGRLDDAQLGQLMRRLYSDRELAEIVSRAMPMALYED